MGEFFLKDIWGSNYQGIWYLIHAIILSLTAVYIYFQLRDRKHAQMLEILFKMRERWNSEQMYAYRKKFCDEFDCKDKNTSFADEQILGFFEDLGLYYVKKVVKMDFIWEEYSYYIIPYWRLLEQKVIQFRKEDDDETWFDKFQKLYLECENYTKKKGVRCKNYSHKTLEKFMIGERALPD